MKTRKLIFAGVLFSGLACLVGMVSCNTQPTEETARAAVEKKGGMVVTTEVAQPEATEAVAAVQRTRLERFGAKKAFVKVNDENQIIAIIPDVQEPERVRRLLQADGRLGFWETYENSEVYPRLQQLNDVLLANGDESLIGLLNPFVTADGEAMRGPAVGLVHASGDGRAALGGEVINAAKVEHNKWSPEPVIDLSMNAEGAKCWQYLTRDNVGKSIGIVVDGQLYSYPTVMCEIECGRSQITGNFTEEEAADLANMLSSGVMPCPVRIVEEQIIESQK